MTAPVSRDLLALLGAVADMPQRERVLMLTLARADAFGVAVFERGELSQLLRRDGEIGPRDKQHTRKAIRRAEAAGYLRPASRSVRLVLTDRYRVSP